MTVLTDCLGDLNLAARRLNELHVLLVLLLVSAGVKISVNTQIRAAGLPV